METMCKIQMQFLYRINAKNQRNYGRCCKKSYQCEIPQDSDWDMIGIKCKYTSTVKKT